MNAVIYRSDICPGGSEEQDCLPSFQPPPTEAFDLSTLKIVQAGRILFATIDWDD